MHNLAIALHKKGHEISGSDDEFFEPSRGRLEKYNLLPENKGWSPEKIHSGLDAVILGMHARIDNPELLKAQELDIKIYSFPEYLYEQTKNKKRVVIAGSHGKTTITSMVMHALRENGIQFDYMVGSIVPGFETMVGFSDDSKVAVFEGDEYLSSPLDKRPKFIHYKPFLTLISGIAWDHINVFPDYEDYVKQFRDLLNISDKNGKLFYAERDEELKSLVDQKPDQLRAVPYTALPYESHDKGNHILLNHQVYPTSLIGRYNMENLSGAMHICEELGLDSQAFLSSMANFSGAGRRQELVFENDDIRIYHDFAHAPSKLRATVEGFRENFKDKKLIALFELHTFSSLNKHFLPEYKDSLGPADRAMVYYNPEVVKHKNLPKIKEEEVFDAFGREGLEVLTDVFKLKQLLEDSVKEKNTILLIMSSGNLGGINLRELIKV